MANEILSIPTTPYIVRALFGSFALSGATGDFNVGDEIEGDVSGAKAIILEVTNPGATPTIRFKYIDPYIAFNGSEAVTNNTVTGAATGSGAVTVENFDISLLQCANFCRVGDSEGGNLLKITVTTGTIKFAIDQDAGVDQPSYTVDDTLELTLKEGNTLKITPTAALDDFILVI
jgi:hypothetical protein